MKYIIWDQKAGEPARNDKGEFLSSGLIGVVGQDNVYIKTYADYSVDDNPRPITELEVGQFVVAKFSLSGSSGIYRVYRVE
jgi:hypothetical protein